MDFIRDLDRQLNCCRSKMRMMLLNIVRLTGSEALIGKSCSDQALHTDEEVRCRRETLGTLGEQHDVTITINEKWDNEVTERENSEQRTTKEVQTIETKEIVLHTSHSDIISFDVNSSTNDHGETNDVNNCDDPKVVSKVVYIKTYDISDKDSSDTDDSDEDNTEEVESDEDNNEEVERDDNQNIVEESYYMPEQKTLTITPIERQYRVEGDLRTTVLMSEARKRLWHITEI